MALNPIHVIQINTANEVTVLHAVSQKHEVKTGFVCVSPNDIECVDGVCNDKSKNFYWTIEVNGDHEKVNSETVVRPQDKILLKYAEYKQ